MRSLGVGIAWGIATFAGFIVATFAGIGSFLGISSLLGCDIRSAVPLPNPCSDLYYSVTFLAALVGGAGLGMAQFATLRLLQIPTSALWVPATGLGFAIPVALALGFPVRAPLEGGISLFILLGLSLGIAQWLILRSRISGSVIWIGGTLASMSVAGLLSRWIIGSLLSWLVASAGSALTLVWLLRPAKARRSVDTAD